jgi:hypothetical protein
MIQYEQPFWILSVSDSACFSDCCILHWGSWSISMLSLHSANQFFNISCPQVPSWFTFWPSGSVFSCVVSCVNYSIRCL